MSNDSIQVEGITKRYGAMTAVDNVSFDVGQGEFVSLLGPSGCGKTTTLRMIAGFVDPSGGLLRSVAATLPTYRRKSAIWASSSKIMHSGPI